MPGGEDPLEKEMATHSRIPWTEEPSRLQFMGSQRVGHSWATSLSFFPSKVERKHKLMWHNHLKETEHCTLANLKLPLQNTVEKALCKGRQWQAKQDNVLTEVKKGPRSWWVTHTFTCSSKWKVSKGRHVQESSENIHLGDLYN